jgi:hypothetical protein
MDTSRFETLLGELKLPFEREQVEDDLARFEIKIDEAEGLEAIALLYSTEDGEMVRLLSYVDELDPDNSTDQLRLLMTLNGDLPTGSFCLDPEEDIIYATVNVPLDQLNAEQLSWLVEFLLVAQEIYDEELNPEGGAGDVVAQG